MNRRENLKLLFTGSIGTGLFLTGCEPEVSPLPHLQLLDGGTRGGRIEEEIRRDQALLAEQFFTEEELKKINILVDIIMPKDTSSPAATEIGVPEFIEFIMKDQPGYQTPMRGGLMWLDFESHEKFGKLFLELSQDETIQLVELVAWPESSLPEYQGGVRWFNMLRNLTCSGYFSTEAGWKYLDYKGNQPNVWDGVPQEVMDKHGFKLDEKYIPLYLKPEQRGTVANWDEKGDLIG
ncbi:gluconate 2-dehydrogenase subunit 3 family protein [Algoriphagus aquimarinus]|uniref:gluconate 2-dehydrogenase subunit 3 family protein n=1 Tax=Algoriphagus aquimarinus TaxID=237018 RepID=UPI0030DA2538|tara:strand:- start:4320 stop:5027 length:708 start_codon:yes stop_codon:yes gene_type:complete